MHRQVSAFTSFAIFITAFGLAAKCYKEQNISTSFPCFWKQNRDFGKFGKVIEIYQYKNYYDTNRTKLGVMWNEIVQASGCNDLTAHGSQMCSCLKEFHTGRFNDEIYNKTQLENPWNNAEVAVMRACLFRHRFTTSIDLFDQMGVYPLSAITYILSIGVICEVVSDLNDQDESWKLFMILPVILACIFIPICFSFWSSSVTSAIPWTMTVIPLSCLTLCMVYCIRNQDALKSFWDKRIYQIEYCFTLLVLVSLYDATQQQRDYYYMVCRILFACGLGLFALWRDPESKKNGNGDILIVWLVGTLFLVGNTPPAKWTSSVLEADPYWTSVFIPTAFYLYVVGMPLAICMMTKDSSAGTADSSQAGTTSEGKQDLTTKGYVCMAVSKGTRLMLFLAVVAAFITEGKKIHVPVPA